MMQYIFSLYFEQYLPMWLLPIRCVPVVRESVTIGAYTKVVEADIVPESGKAYAFASTHR